MHMIDTTNARNNIAYVGETPWHKLGAVMLPGMDRDEWRRQAGLAHEVRESVVEYTDAGGQRHLYGDRKVLYRSDSLKPLSVVGSDYRIVQPGRVIDFFSKLIDANRFTLETAGSLDGGRKVWALAKAGEGETVVGQDAVKPYVLFCTSYDTSMATTARFTSVRVVCWNTLSMAYNQDEKGGKIVKVPHSRDFDDDEVRLDLGIVMNAYEKFMVEAKLLANRRVNDTFCTEFLRSLLPPPVKTETMKDGTKIVRPGDIEDSKAYQQIMALFRGEAMGAGLNEANGTAWGLLNAITQHVDWQRGRSDNTRMNSAWFGAGAELKEKARDLLLEVVR